MRKLRRVGSYCIADSCCGGCVVCALAFWKLGQKVRDATTRRAGFCIRHSLTCLLAYFFLRSWCLECLHLRTFYLVLSLSMMDSSPPYSTPHRQQSAPASDATHPAQNSPQRLSTLSPSPSSFTRVS